MKSKKKILSLALLLPLIGTLTLTSCNSSSGGEGDQTQSEEVTEFLEWAKDFTYNQYAGEDGVKAKLDDNELSSTDDTIVLTGYTGTATELVIPEAVRGVIKIVGIASSCFANNTNLTKVTLPDTIETIEGTSFTNMTNLTQMNLPEQTVVSPGSFNGTQYLLDTYVKNEGALNIVNNNAIYSINKANITDTVTIPEGIVSIPDNCFSGVTSLTDIVFSSSVEEIGQNAFKGTSLVDVNLPKTIHEVGTGAFGSIKTLRSFTTFDIEQGIENTDEVYSEMTMTGAILSGSTENLEIVAYPGETTLKTFLGTANAPKLTTVYVDATNVVADCFKDFPNLTTLGLANSVKIVNEGAFDNLSNITTFYPNSYSQKSNLGYIPNAKYVQTDSKATTEKVSIFDSPWYTNLYSSTPDNSYIVLGGLVFDKKGTPNVGSIFDGTKELHGFGDGLFINDLTLTDNELSTFAHDKIYAVGVEAFSKTKIKDINFENCTFVGDKAFADADTLERLTLGAECVFGDNILQNDYQIKYLNIPGTSTLEKLIGKYDVRNGVVTGKPYQLEELVVAEGTKEILNNAFYRAENLVKVTLPSTLEKIGMSSFMFNSKLKEVYIPYSVKTISELAFAECKSLSKVTFQDAKVNVGEGETDYSNSQDAVSVPTGIPNRLELYGSVFSNCTSLPETFELPFRVRRVSQCFIGSSVKTLVVKLTDKDRMYKNCEGFNPVTDSSSSVQFSIGFNQTDYTVSDNPNPNGAAIKVVGQGSSFAIK